MNEIEGVADAVTGGMLARSAEPEAGEAAREGDADCSNCGTALAGPYCRMCGQKAHVHRTISAIGHDLLHSILHLDGKFWRTLPLLAWRPGELTRRYVHGERAKFVSPMGMFLFAVFLMFAVLQIYGLSLSSLDSVSGVQIRRGLDDARVEMVRDLDEARRERVAATRGEVVRYRGQPQSAAQIDSRIGTMQRELGELDQIRSRAGRLDLGGEQGNFTTGWSRLDHGLAKFSENPGLALYKLQSNGYKFSWLLIPLSVPFLWLLFFWTRRFRFYDHTVFVTYSLAFMSMAAILLMVLGFAGLPSPVIAFAALIVPPVHIFRQLKAAYQLHWVGALVRTFLLVNFCFVTASLFFALLLGIGALG
jgi:hypothetical protein